MSISASQLFWPRGRANRAPYWVCFFGVNGLTHAVDRIEMPDPANALQFGIFLIIVGLFSVYIAFSLFIGRLHDIDRSGWWSLPIVFPAVVLGILIEAAKDSPELSELFKGQTFFVWVFAGIFVVVCIGGAFYVGLKRGTQGPNRFGPDPLVKPILA